MLNLHDDTESDQIPPHLVRESIVDGIMEHLEVNDEREGGNGRHESIKIDPGILHRLISAICQDAR
jgi:hypothetical protein